MKKIILCLTLVYSMVFLTACPKETVLRRAAKASYSLSGLTVDVINATGKAYAAQLINLETKDRLARHLKTISIGGERFNQTLKRYAEEGTEIPADKLLILNKIFSEEVVAPFLEVLNAIKLLSPEQSAYLNSAINGLRAAILIISGAFTNAGIETNARRIESYV
jgi:hypothetical protein